MKKAEVTPPAPPAESCRHALKRGHKGFCWPCLALMKHDLARDRGLKLVAVSEQAREMQDLLRRVYTWQQNEETALPDGLEKRVRAALRTKL